MKRHEGNRKEMSNKNNMRREMNKCKGLAEERLGAKGGGMTRRGEDGEENKNLGNKSQLLFYNNKNYCT
jgi:hypothetical protein